MIYNNGSQFITFEDEPSEETPITASNLNNLQSQIRNALNGKMECGSSSRISDANESICTYAGIYNMKSNTLNIPFVPTTEDLLIVFSHNGYENIIQIAYDSSEGEIWIRYGTQLYAGYIEGATQYKFNPDSMHGEWTRLYSPETILYEDNTNANGTQGNVSLSDTAENYERIKIYYAREEGENAPKRCMEIDNPNGKYLNLSQVYPANEAGILQIFGDSIHINNTNIQRISSMMVGLCSTGVQQFGNNPSTGTCRIYKVVGHKKMVRS